jgi:hypothetical protein
VAHLSIDGCDLLVTLSRLEKLEAVHGNVRLPVSAITSVRAVTEPWCELRGIRAPGTGIPRIIAVGTRRGSFGKDFVVVHGAGEAVVVDLSEDAAYHRLVVTTQDSAAVAARIEAARMEAAR